MGRYALVISLFKINCYWFNTLREDFNTLREDSNLWCPQQLTDEAKKHCNCLNPDYLKIEFSKADFNFYWQLIILPTNHIPIGCLWQQGPSEWLHLSPNHKNITTPYCALVSTLIIKGRYISKELFGEDVDEKLFLTILNSLPI